MKGKKVVYVSDQKFYKTPDNEWYTTASFPEEIINIFGEINQWTFLGRLYEIKSGGDLYKINTSIKNIDIKFDGVWEAKPGISGYASNLFSMLKIILKNINKSDIIYLKFNFVNSYITGTMSKFRNKLLITHMVGDIECTSLVKNNIFVKSLEKVQKLLYRAIVKKADIQLYVSNDLKNKYAYGNAYTEVINENRFSEANIISGKELNSPTTRSNHQELRLLFVGRISPEKGIDDVIYAMGDCENVTLDIIGTGEHEKVLKKIITEKNLNDRIRFLGYVNWGEELFEKFRDYHLLVLPSYSEGLPLVIVEAMSMGLPVLASNVGGIPEVLKNGESGLLFSPGNVNEIVEKINYINLNEKERQKYIIKSLKVAKQYSFESQLRLFKEVIEKQGANI